MSLQQVRILCCCFCLLLLAACDGQTPNNPYPKRDRTANIYYSSFSERPKTLDPARSYSSNEYVFIAQILEPPLQYHYLKRPYTLVPLAAERMPKVEYFSKSNQPLSANASAKEVAYSVYTVQIKAKRYYQPHPAFAKNDKGVYYYHDLTADDLEQLNIYQLSDFRHRGTKELTAADYVYQIKRLAHPGLNSPIYGLMANHIVGFNAFHQALKKAYHRGRFLDLRQFALSGVTQLDRYRYQIKIKGKYPQFMFWLAMPFFAPLPFEADYFYAQAGMKDHNITLDWYPVGTGAYQLTVNDPNRQMVMEKNPNFGGERYPTEGMPGDKAKGLLADAGLALPFVDKVIYTLEKEAVPRWNKFLQGYYDASGISSDSFDQAIHIDLSGKAQLSRFMQDKQIRLQTVVGVSDFYMGFNMLDDVVGGYSERARYLRQAIAIALDYEEFISIFLNGRGIPASGPIPPGIFGYQGGREGMNPYLYDWVDGKAKRKSLADAKALLVKAGYPNGRDIKSGKPLLLNYDVPASAGPDDKARFDWMRKQFAKIGIALNIRATQYNRFQEKMRTGNAQMFSWGWHADYPDPENFLFLLYGPNSKVTHGGENAANYENPEFDALFREMKNMDNGPARQAMINKMIAIARRDTPWVWGFHPKNFTLSQQWSRVTKPNELANNTLKYVKIDPIERAKARQAWNKPIVWPVLVFLLLLIASGIPVYLRYRRHERQSSLD